MECIDLPDCVNIMKKALFLYELSNSHMNWVIPGEYS